MIAWTRAPPLNVPLLSHSSSHQTSDGEIRCRSSLNESFALPKHRGAAVCFSSKMLCCLGYIYCVGFKLEKGVNIHHSFYSQSLAPGINFRAKSFIDIYLMCHRLTQFSQQMSGSFVALLVGTCLASHSWMLCSRKLMMEDMYSY